MSTKNEERIAAMKDVIIEDLKAQAGTPEANKPSEATFYKAVEPDGVTKDSMATHVKAVVNYTAAGVAVSRDLALEAMKADPAMENFQTTLDLGAFGHSDINIARQQDYKVGNAEGTNYGVCRNKLTFAPGRASTPINAELAATRAIFKEQFGEAETK